MTIYDIFGFFLISIWKFCTTNFFREYLVLVTMIAKTLNLKGDFFIGKEDKKKN